MSLSNNPLRPSQTSIPDLSQNQVTKTTSTQTSQTLTESQTKPSSQTSVSNPEAFKKTTETTTSTIPDTDQLKNTDVVVDQTAPSKLSRLSNSIPKPNILSQSLPVLGGKVPDAPPLPQTDGLSQSEFGNELIKPNFSKLCKELDRTIFTKGKVYAKAQERGKLIAELTPPGSDLMKTFAGSNDQQLRELVASGIALTKPKKYGPETTYKDLSRNKQKMVDAIVAGIKSGLPKEIEMQRQHPESVDGGQIQLRQNLNQQIRNAKIQAPSQDRLDQLEKKIAEKGIDAIREKLKQDSESLRKDFNYTDLPVPDPSETSLSVLGDKALKAVLPVDGGIKGRILAEINKIDEKDAKGLNWTLSTKPFNQTCDEVAQLLYGKKLSELGDSESQTVSGLAKSLVVTSLEKVGPGEGNRLIDKDGLGPTEITYNNKTFERVNKLGEGGFGVAFLFKERGGTEEIVVKSFKNNSMNDEAWFGAMQDEIRTHRYAMGPEGKGHENVLGLRGIVTRPPEKTEHFGELYTITDVAKGGELRDVMKTLHDQLRDGRISKTVSDLLNRQVFAQTIEGMHYIQKDRQMLHLDLKPENLFMTSNGTVKVGDFGLANIGHNKDNTGGTAIYVSPEAVGGKVDYHADTWTLGIIGRELFTGTRALPENGVIPKKDAPGMYGPIMKAYEFGTDKDNRVYQSEDQSKGVTGTQFEGSDGVERPLLNLGGFHQLMNAMQHPDPKQRPNLDVVRQHEFVSDPILKAKPLQDLLGKLTQRTKDMSPQELEAHQKEIVRLNGEVESLARH